jgi:hypothetical protein
MITDNRAPHSVATKYELAHNDGTREQPRKSSRNTRNEPPFDGLHQPVDPELRIHLHRQVYLMRQGLQLHQSSPFTASTSAMTSMSRASMHPPTTRRRHLGHHLRCSLERDIRVLPQRNTHNRQLRQPGVI